MNLTNTSLKPLSQQPPSADNVTTTPADNRPIGVFDSGVGGLSTLRELVRLLPHEQFIYFGDQGHVPYGPRPLVEIQGFVRGIAEFFLERQVKAIVIACNAASAAGLKHIRELHPELPIVGMEPAIKPAAEKTRTGVIGVITTKATYQGELFASVIDRFAKDRRVETQVCPDFVTLVEAGKLDGPEAEEAAERYLKPLVDAGIDQLVLGCTHFPFIEPLIRRMIGDEIEIVDPGPAIARQTSRVIAGMASSEEQAGSVAFFTSGDLSKFHTVAERLLERQIGDEEAKGATWLDGEHVKS
jgi:glutamate racemase